MIIRRLELCVFKLPILLHCKFMLYFAHFCPLPCIIGYALLYFTAHNHAFLHISPHYRAFPRITVHYRAFPRITTHYRALPRITTRVSHRDSRFLEIPTFHFYKHSCISHDIFSTTHYFPSISEEPVFLVAFVFVVEVTLCMYKLHRSLTSHSTCNFLVFWLSLNECVFGFFLYGALEEIFPLY